MTESAREVEKALQAMGLEVFHAKGKGGGFWIRGLSAGTSGRGYVSMAQARKLTGIPAPKRTRRKRIAAWGDYATVAMMNGGK